jgi:hypothetical protein
MAVSVGFKVFALSKFATIFTEGILQNEKIKHMPVMNTTPTQG